MYTRFFNFSPAQCQISWNRDVNLQNQSKSHEFPQPFRNFCRRWRLLNSLKLREGITHEGDSLERAGASHAQEMDGQNFVNGGVRPQSMASFIQLSFLKSLILTPLEVAMGWYASQQEIILLSREGDQRNADLETVGPLKPANAEEIVQPADLFPGKDRCFPNGFPNGFPCIDISQVRVMVALSSLRQPVKCKVFAEVGRIPHEIPWRMATLCEGCQWDIPYLWAF